MFQTGPPRPELLQEIQRSGFEFQLIEKNDGIRFVETRKKRKGKAA